MLCLPGLVSQSLGTQEVPRACRRGGSIQEGFLEEGARARTEDWVLEDSARPWGGGAWSWVMCFPGLNTPVEQLWGQRCHVVIQARERSCWDISPQSPSALTPPNHQALHQGLAVHLSAEQALQAEGGHWPEGGWGRGWVGCGLRGSLQPCAAMRREVEQQGPDMGLEEGRRVPGSSQRPLLQEKGSLRAWAALAHPPAGPVSLESRTELCQKPNHLSL